MPGGGDPAAQSLAMERKEPPMTQTPIRVSCARSGRHFVKQDNTPFFWLADTAWNAPLRADAADWRRYLAARQEQGFTAIQFVSTPWRGCRNPLHGPLFSETSDGVTFNEHAWEKMEEWMGLIVAHHMVPAPVMIWDNNPDEAFFKRRPETCISVGKRMLERWRKFSPVWILNGDGGYTSVAQDKKWKTIGREIFGSFPDETVTCHPCGISWVGDQFAAEPWYSFVGVQSGHGSSLIEHGFLQTGPYANRWRDIKKPFINLELNYEFATSYQEPDLQFNAYHVRRAIWWSLLAAPPAGVTYGNNPIWIWALTANEQAEGHGNLWCAANWESGLYTAGIANLRVILSILEDLPWTDMLPADQLITRQLGWDTPSAFVKASATSAYETVVAYAPLGGRISLNCAMLSSIRTANWIDPRAGAMQACRLSTDGSGTVYQLEAPNKQDWLLVLKK